MGIGNGRRAEIIKGACAALEGTPENARFPKIKYVSTES